MASVSGPGYRYGPRAAAREEPPTTVLNIPERSARRATPRVRWHTGADLGLLVLRLVLGVVFLAHGAQKLFGSLGGPGLDGFADFLAANGFQQTSLLAGITAITELAGGAMLVLGLGTPLAAAGLLGVMINAIWLKLGAGLLGTQGPQPGQGYELEFVLAGTAAAVALVGAGRVAFDRSIPLFRRPLLSGMCCLVIGVGAAVAVRLLLHR